MSAPATKPTVIGAFQTSRGQADVTAHPGNQTVSIALGIVSATTTAAEAVIAAQLLLNAARVALGEGRAS